MSNEINMGAGVNAPFKAKEGNITINTAASAHGECEVPVLSAGLKKEDLVEIADDWTVAAHASGVPIGYISTHGKWIKTEPRAEYTQAQALTAEMLREFGVQTFFKTIKTVDAKSGQGIKAGDYITLKAQVEKSTSATNVIAITAQDNNNRVVIGIL